MLSVRLSEQLEKQLTEYCKTMRVSKTEAVQTALETLIAKSFNSRINSKSKGKKSRFLALVGTGNGRFTTEQVMRMTRGEDWNKP
jgi:hypothetical protein